MKTPRAAGRNPRRVACPRCAATSEYSPANRWRPFCSERCKHSDLGAWASESYRVDVATPTADDDTPPRT